MPRVTLKTSTIFVSIGEETRVYHSFEEIPPPLRQQLERSTNGLNAATILIADRRGRQEIARAIRGLPAAVKSSPESRAVQRGSVVAKFLVRHWMEILLPPILGLATWLLYTLH